MKPDVVSLTDVCEAVEVDRIEADRFSGRALSLGWGYTFAGQFLAQGLSAAQQTAGGAWGAHSLHAYFLLAGDENKPITYEVERMRDGRSFAARRVDAVQDSRVLFTMTVSFQREEAGVEHQDAMPTIAGPEGLSTQAQLARKYLDASPDAMQSQMSFEAAFEIRPADPVDLLKPAAKPPLHGIWYRAKGEIPVRACLHRGLLAYVSGTGMLSVALRPNALSWSTPGLQSAALDHALWFHRPFRIDEWLLFVIDSPSLASARALTRGRFFTQDGRLVASVAQEGLVRVRSCSRTVR